MAKKRPSTRRTSSPGDIVRLEEGDMIPADLRLIRVSSLRVNESTLTGESVPVEKSSDALTEGRAESDTGRPGEHGVPREPAVTSGNADGVVIATGRYTQVGDIAQSMREAEEGSTPLQARMGRLGTRISIVVVAVAVLGFVIGVATGNDVKEMLLTARRHRRFGHSGRPADRHDRRPGRGRPPHGQTSRHDPATAGGRNARQYYRHLHRQDGHAYPEPNDGPSDSRPAASLTTSPEAGFHRRAKSVTAIGWPKPKKVRPSTTRSWQGRSAPDAELGDSEAAQNGK